jgi:sulfhydrogenase subunit beta (sulfur reductase)
MSPAPAPAPASVAVLSLDGLGALVDALRRRGFQVIGPVHRDAEIVLDELRSAADLPAGWGVTVEAGTYRTRRRGDGAVFGHSSGSQSWKSYLHPARERVWSARRDGDGFVVEPEDTGPAALCLSRGSPL